MTTQRHIGGSFAPPLDEVGLAEYEALAAAAPEEISDEMRRLINCYKQWWDLPESGPDGSRPHPIRGTIVPLDEPIAKALWDCIPWRRELDSMAELFLEIDIATNKPLRDAAFHLLWFARELEGDREPLTNDRL